MTKLSVVLPSYNEAKELEKSVGAIAETLESLTIPYEIIIVNDGSRDDSMQVADAIAAKNPCVKAVGYTRNQGKGYALKYGYSFATGELVLFHDADSDLPPAQIPNFLDCLNSNGNDIIIGTKWHPQSKVSFPKNRTFYSKCYNMLVRALFNLKIKDTQVGIKLFRRKVLDSIMPEVSVKRYACDVELLAYSHRKGFHIGECPVELNYQNDSKIGMSDILKIFMDTLMIFYKLNFVRGTNGHNGNGKV